MFLSPGLKPVTVMLDGTLVTIDDQYDTDGKVTSIFTLFHSHPLTNYKLTFPLYVAHATHIVFVMIKTTPLLGHTVTLEAPYK